MDYKSVAIDIQDNMVEKGETPISLYLIIEVLKNLEEIKEEQQE